MNKFMRILIFFDLPVTSKQQRKVATQFRSFLLKDGYTMVQYSIYSRVCNGYDAVSKHKERIYKNLPDNGSVRLLVLTEKQYSSIEILVGKLTTGEGPEPYEQLSIY
ncbi:MAG: CRISPR-associated endonuclease Cas2 [Acutalibacteraceae bacterium]|jgi:CRISPR-associated protein Cas2|nr:CRISPR-associated endonuclease Cas2 [Clostridiales bacterium]